MNQNLPLITIVTITFNLKKNGREKFFRQCVESVHSQTYQNIEHIIVDGASSDGTLDLIKEYAEKDWVNCISEPDGGVYDAMNKGIGLAKGEFINFLNSDDFFHSKKAVETSVKYLLDSGADYSFAETRAMNAITGEVIGTWAGNINMVPFGLNYCHQSMFTRTSVIRDLGCFDLNYKVSADSDLMIKLLAAKTPFVHVPDEIVTYRSHGLSNQDTKGSRRDHSTSFWKHVGKNYGLSKEDCYLIWNFSIFHEKSFLYGLWFGRKLKNSDWRKEYYHVFWSYESVKNRIVARLPKFIKSPLRRVYRMVLRRGN